MLKKLNFRNSTLNTLIWLLAITTFFFLLTSCRGPHSPRENEPSTEDPAVMPLPAVDLDESEQTTGNESAGQDSGQSSKQPSEEKAQPEPLIIDEDLKLGELQVDMPKETMEELIKAKLTDSKTDDSYGFESEILIYDDGTEIHLVDGKIYSISVSAPEYPTPRGLRAGDTAEKVKELYGEPAAIEEDSLWVYSVRGYDLFFVTINDGKVVSIKVSQVM